MATVLSKPVARETKVMVKDGGGKARALIVTLVGEYLVLRLKGRRAEETINLEHAYFGAIKARKWRDQMVKAQVRAANKRAKR